MATKINNPSKAHLQRLKEFIKGKENLVLLSGAGLSKGSGIPTYRNRSGKWTRQTPITHQDFISKKTARQQYWLRSFNGWPAFSAAIPSASHLAITKLEKNNFLKTVVPQNVDRLHQKAGTKKVIDLHGRLDEVTCMKCHCVFEREAIQSKLKTMNPFLLQANNMAPDGDADVNQELTHAIAIPTCDQCEGILKPNVVFFGDNVEKPVVDSIYNCIDESDGLLIIGSSLKVFSGYRFCRYAAKKTKPIASINPGIARGEDLIPTLIRSDADELLPHLFDKAEPLNSQNIF